MATHSSIFAWIIPWTGKPEGLQFMGSQRVGIIHPGTKFLPICRKQKTSYLFEIHSDKVNIRYQLQTFSSNSGNGKNKSSNKSQTNFTRHQHLRIIPCVCVCVCVCVSCSVMSNFLQPRGLQFTRLLCQWDSPSKNTGVGCHFLLQGFFLTQGSNPDLPHLWQILYHLSHQGSPTGIIRVAVS